MHDTLLAELAGRQVEQHAAFLAYAEANAEAWQRFTAEQTQPPANEQEA
jgi:hypothetical protein